ncbi:hypothetical protein TNCV_952011 [Trichonephila clavipes]|nr:hypothetical protein TNCV_952011 [Trichonephila clavipes]
MPKMQTCRLVQMVTAELRYECFTRTFLIDQCRIAELFSGYIINFVKHVRFTSSDVMLVNEAWKKKKLEHWG